MLKECDYINMDVDIKLGMVCVFAVYCTWFICMNYIDRIICVNFLSPQVCVCHFQIEQLKQELHRKESEMQALQTKLETLTNQNSDSKQHIEVLKESLNAKEQRANTLQTEVST